MIGMIETAKVSIEMRGIDIIALKKLSLVLHALAARLGDRLAAEEQKCLCGVLDDTIRKIELAAALLPAQGG